MFVRLLILVPNLALENERRLLITKLLDNYELWADSVQGQIFAAEMEPKYALIILQNTRKRYLKLLNVKAVIVSALRKLARLLETFSSPRGPCSTSSSKWFRRKLKSVTKATREIQIRDTSNIAWCSLRYITSFSLRVKINRARENIMMNNKLCCFSSRLSWIY